MSRKILELPLSDPKVPFSFFEENCGGCIVERLTPSFRYIVKFTVGDFLVLVLSERIWSKIENCLLRYIDNCLLCYIENWLLH